MKDKRWAVSSSSRPISDDSKIGMIMLVRASRNRPARRYAECAQRPATPYVPAKCLPHAHRSDPLNLNHAILDIIYLSKYLAFFAASVDRATDRASAADRVEECRARAAFRIALSIVSITASKGLSSCSASLSIWTISGVVFGSRATSF